MNHQCKPCLLDFQTNNEYFYLHLQFKKEIVLFWYKLAHLVFILYFFFILSVLL